MDPWIGVAGGLFAALFAFLGGLVAAERGARRAFEYAAKSAGAQRAAIDQDHRAALRSEVGANLQILDVAVDEHKFGLTQRVAWETAIGLHFADPVRAALQRAYALAAVYDAATRRIPTPGNVGQAD